MAWNYDRKPMILHARNRDAFNGLDVAIPSCNSKGQSWAQIMWRAALLVLAVGAVRLVVETSVAHAACPVVSDAPALIDRLKGGGFILVFRHADRYSQTGEPRQPADLGRELPQGCTQPRQALTASGFAQAKAIGESLKDVPVDNVFATTACRTIETARFAFDRSQLLEMSLDEAIRLAPANGKNTIIVSHGERIADALTALNSDDDRIPACGEAAVIDPSGDQERPECLAMVLPREWNPANGETALGWENGRECNPR